MIQFICYPKCTTCQKALRWLDDNKKEYHFRDITENNPSIKEITTLYKSMELKTKLLEMPEEDQIKLLATDGMLVKRPLIIGDGFVLVGFKENEWSKIL